MEVGIVRLNSVAGRNAYVNRYGFTDSVNIGITIVDCAAYETQVQKRGNAEILANIGGP